MSINQMNTRVKIYISSLSFALIALCLIIFLIYPTLIEINENSKNILETKNNLSLMEKQSLAIDEFKNYKIDVKKIDQLFIDPQNPVDFIKFLEYTASITGVNLNTNVQSVKNKSGDLSVTIFQLNITGNFINLLKFSEKLEYGPYLIGANNIIIKKVSDTDSNEIEANLLIEVAVK